jgi:quinol monooxygenase YgiN
MASQFAPISRRGLILSLVAVPALAGMASDPQQGADQKPPRAKDMTDLSNIVLLYAAEGKSALLGAALNELVTLTRQESGCAICELNQSTAEPDTWMVYERWRGQAAFDSHMKQPYVASFLGKLGELQARPPEVRPFQYRG